MKSVLISIKPKYCELIASGKKTVEVRKTKPKLETPFKAHIYCTQGKPLMKTESIFFIDNDYKEGENLYGLYELVNGKVIGEFICDRIDEHICTELKYGHIYKYDTVSIKDEKAAFLEFGKLEEYGGGKPLYFWHISNLVLYDKPRELSEFHKPTMPTGLRYENDTITRPPQSWGYVESEDTE